MAKKKRIVKYSGLSGLKLYNELLKKLGEQNKKKPQLLQLGIRERRKIVSEQLYPQLKNQKVNATSINRIVSKIVRTLPPLEACNPLYLSPAYLEAIEYYDIDNRLRNLLPDCVDVRVNAGSYGKTRIFNTRRYSYTGDGVKRIVEKIRDELNSNLSGFAYFSGIVKLKANKPNDGKGSNYFIDFILYINDKTEVDTTPADVSLPSKSEKKKSKVRDYLIERFDKLEKEKKRVQRQKKKKSPQELNKKIDAAINALRALLKSKLITKSEFNKRKNELEAKKRKP